jgi:hypothetical protein
VKRIDSETFRSLDFANPFLFHRLIRLVDAAVSLPKSFAPMNEIAGPSATIERLRFEAGLAAREETPWQDVLVEMVDLANEVLTVKRKAIRQPALRNCQNLLVRYLGAFPLSNAETYA